MPPAKRYKLRSSAVVALVVLAFSVAAVGVSAYEPCQRFVQKYVEKVVPRHYYSKTTLARWAEWGKAHPNYHPPKRRPRLEPKETLDKVNFDCAVPPEPVLVSGLLKPELPEELPLLPTLVAINTAPAVIPRPVSLVDVPVQAPLADTIDTPEPHSGVLVLTGVTFVFLAFGLRAFHIKQDLFSNAVAL